MAIKIKTQKDYLVTEATIELPANLVTLEDILRAAKSTGKIVAVYNQGGVLGVNIEQRTRISESVADDVRKLIGVNTKEIS